MESQKEQIQESPLGQGSDNTLTREEREALSECNNGHTADVLRFIEWFNKRGEELSDGEVLKLLPYLPSNYYERVREKVSRTFGFRPGYLDKLRKKEKHTQALQRDGQGTPITMDAVPPWDGLVDIRTVLNDLATTVHKYIYLSPAAADAVALWIAYTWLYDSFNIAPILCVVSPTRRCGKTHLMELICNTVNRPMPSSNISAAAVYRAIEEAHPTLLMDEADSFLGMREDLRGIINSGHTRKMAYVIRVVGDDQEVRMFSTFSPKAISLIGKPPSTIADRSIFIHLQRKRPDQVTNAFRQDRLPEEMYETRQKLARWAQDAEPYILDLELKNDPPFLNDREADNWRSLFAIANAASRPDEEHSWFARAMDAARILSAGADDDDLNTQLLTDIYTVFRMADRPIRLSTSYIIEQLANMEERRWGELCKGKTITPRRLGDILRGFGIQSTQWKDGGTNYRGYHFEDFRRYEASYIVSETPPQSGTDDNSLQDNELGSPGLEGRPGTKRDWPTGSEESRDAKTKRDWTTLYSTRN